MWTTRNEIAIEWRSILYIYFIKDFFRFRMSQGVTDTTLNVIMFTALGNV